jgi:t-SNARE complex subunit (syntaxin)
MSGPIDATGILGATLAVGTVAALTRKGVFSSQEAVELIDDYLLNFETHTAMATGDLAPALKWAREYCEAAIAQIRALR